MSSQIDDLKRHIDLHHKDFKKLCVANFLFAVSAYMMLPILLLWTNDILLLDRCQGALGLLAFGIGTFSLGGFCSFLIQKYRRNKVCIISMLLLALSSVALAYYSQELPHRFTQKEAACIVFALRFIAGAFFGLAFLILNSTLIVDCCESSNRTRANVVSLWFYRFAVVVGPLLGFVMYKETGIVNSMYYSALVAVISVGILSSVQFPFKAPDDTVHLFCLDRFFNPLSYPLIFMTVAIAMVMGITLVCCNDALLFLSLFLGFLVAFGIRSIMPNAKSHHVFVYISLLILACGIFCLSSYSSMPPACHYVGFILTGYGIAALSSALQVLFINVGDHCQRGTSQSTYILSFEFGIAAGCSISFISTYKVGDYSLLPCLVCLGLAVLSYIYMSAVWLKSNLRK